MKIKLIIISTIITLISCNTNHSVRIKIDNQLNKTIKSIIISNSVNDTLILENIKSGDHKQDYLNFNNQIMADGDYTIIYSTYDTSDSKKFGYFTNGYPLDNGFNITIHKDEIKIDSY